MVWSYAEGIEHLRLAARISAVEVEDYRPPESRWSIVRHVRLHYLDWGGRGGTPILFLHGGCLNAHTWDVVCLALRSRRHCLALDQRGHGESDWSVDGTYTFDAHVADIESFVDDLGLNRFALVGHSMGGANATLYTARHPERVTALVLVDVGASFRNEGGAEVHAFLQEVPRASVLEDFIERAVAFNPLRDPRLLRRSLLHNLRRLPDGRWAWKYDPRIVARLDLEEMAARMERLWEALRAIHCPTLVVRGALSTIFTDEDAAAAARALGNGRWVRVIGAAHNIQGDNPKALAETIGGFLASS